jgi:hypothetical protein
MIRRVLACCIATAVLALAPHSAHASRDAVQFFSNIDVPAGSSVHDAVCFFCSVHARGNIDHDTVVFFGNVDIASRANHDIVNFFGSVHADDDASIGHDLVSIFGSVHLGSNVSVGNDMVILFGGYHAASSVSVTGNRVYQPAWILWIPFGVLALIIVGIVSAVRAHRRRQLLYYYPPHP